MVGISNSCGFCRIPSGIPWKFQGNSHGFPVEFEWNSYGFQVEFEWNLDGIP